MLHGLSRQRRRRGVNGRTPAEGGRGTRPKRRSGPVRGISNALGLDVAAMRPHEVGRLDWLEGLFRRTCTDFRLPRRSFVRTSYSAVSSVRRRSLSPPEEPPIDPGSAGRSSRRGTRDSRSRVESREAGGFSPTLKGLLTTSAPPAPPLPPSK